LHLANTSPKIKAVRDVPTMADNPIPLRVVIPQLGTYPVTNYRVIVYGDEFKPRHWDFSSAVAKSLEGNWRPELPSEDY
jgi:hypothetical protein